MARTESYCLTGPIYQWLIDNRALAKYVTINSLRVPTDPIEYKIFITEKKSKELAMLGEITNFLNLKLLTRKPHPPNVFPPAPPGSSHKIIMLIPMIRFIQTEKYNIEMRNFNEAVDICTHVIDFLYEDQIPDSVGIEVNVTDLFTRLVKESERLKRLDKKFEIMVTNLCDFSTKEPSNFDQTESLLIILGRCMMIYNSNIHFIELNPHQEVFNQWLFSPSLPVAWAIQEFLENFQHEPRSNFTNNLFGLFDKLKIHFPQSDPVLGSIFVIMFFRSMFEAAVAIDYQYFFPSSQSFIIPLIEKITISDLSPPLELLPKCSATETARKVYSRDEDYFSAGSHVTKAFFYTNPLDALYEIHLALKSMHKGISKKKKENGVLEFETIFSLFFGSLLTAEMPDLEGLVNFIVDFSPTNRLAPEFQYAQVTMNAVISQFHIFEKELIS